MKRRPAPTARFARFGARLPKPLRNRQRRSVHNDGSRNMPKMSDPEKENNPNFRRPVAKWKP